ncbi:hypothetical protein [Nonomuraea sp. NPDC049709]|uniref:hypothetical protein n=1 Tax=Nonomuraea sp. NPDC049709 TaxID=3154736 RepID=UPI0034139551
MGRKLSLLSVFGVGTLVLVLALLYFYPGEWRQVLPGDEPTRPVGGTTEQPATPSRGASLEALPRVPWEGGPAYYGKFGGMATTGWTDPAFFPVGVWLESVVEPGDAAGDKALGLNTYMGLTSTSSAQRVREGGMWAFTDKPLDGHGDETVGWVIDDEADMWAGPGDAKWTGNHPGEGPLCVPEDQSCGYTVLTEQKKRLPKDGRLHYANFGKGVIIWENDQQAGRFVNDYTDVTSADVYWYTSEGICQDAKNYINVPLDKCRRAANYGMIIEKLRRLDALDKQLQPVYAVVEVGWPGVDDKRTIEPDELAGAVMSSLIHEARGILYFNHNFGGPCQSQHVLRERCGDRIRPTVVELNKRIAQLAPVLNTQSYRYEFGEGLDTMLKRHGDALYVFAMPDRDAEPGTRRLTLPAGVEASQAEVLFEGRTVPIDGSGRFSDSFAAEHSYHIYKIPL